jgi:CMP/dCMP kinase
MIIAIDGPAGSGKSTVAKRVASRLGIRYLDTGAMYRAVAYRALVQGCTGDEAALAEIVGRERIRFVSHGAAVRVIIGEEDVTSAIRTPEVDSAVSAVASMPLVREAMVAQQRQIAQDGDFVIEGRDIGTVVFPDAGLKVYLTASPEERARRRAAQQKERGVTVAAGEVREALERRDEHDSTREHSPLATAADAVLVDTTDLTLEQVIEQVAKLAEERMR